MQYITYLNIWGVLSKITVNPWLTRVDNEDNGLSKHSPDIQVGHVLCFIPSLPPALFSMMFAGTTRWEWYREGKHGVEKGK